MSFRLSSEGEIYSGLRKGFAVGALLASVIELMCLFRPDYHWLQRLGLLGVIVFSTGNAVLVYWPRGTRSRLEEDGRQGGNQ